MAIDPKKHRDEDIKEITQSILNALKQDGVAIKENSEDATRQIGIGAEKGIEESAKRIEASSVKITKAFRDLAKKITNQKDIFNISLGSKDVVIDIDFSDIDINDGDFQKKIDEVFEKIKIGGNIEFDSKAAEKQFKNMLGLHIKYADKLSKLQAQKPKLTNPESIKANAKEQLAIIDGLKEIRRVMSEVSDVSISLPSVHYGDEKALRAEIDLIDQIARGEEKVGKQRDTNAEKIRKENKELRERNKLLEESVASSRREQERAPTKSQNKKPRLLENVGVMEDYEEMQDAKTATQKRKAAAEIVKGQYALYKKLEEARDNDGVTKSGEVFDVDSEDLTRQKERVEVSIALFEKYGGQVDKLGKKIHAFAEEWGMIGQYAIEAEGYQIGEEMLAFGSQLSALQDEFGDTSKWLSQYTALMDQIRQGSLTAAEAVAKLREEMAAQPPTPKASSDIPPTDDIVAEFKELVKPGDIDDIGDIKAENGALEDRLELLKEISDQYGVDGLNKDAKAYYKLWLKEMDDQEFNASQQERYDETSDSLENAAKNLVSFGAAYDKIIVKFGKGKPLEILPNAKGLEDLAKIANEYGEAYNGKEISDVVFVRTKESAEAAARAAEEAFNAELESAVASEVEEELKAVKQTEEQEEERAKQAQAVVQLVDNYGKSLDEVNSKLMQGTKLLNEQGQIIRLFHNSPNVFDEFDPEKAGSNQGQALGQGSYLAKQQNLEFNRLEYGRYQTQWYANVQNPFEAGGKLTSDQAASVIDKFLADRADGFKDHMLSKLLDGDVINAIKDIADIAKVEVGEVFGHIGYDAVMDGTQINVFDPSKIHRANDAVLDIGTEEFDAFRELQNKIWEEQKIIKNAKDQIKKLSNEYEGQTADQLNDALFFETLIKGPGWRDDVAKIASAFRKLTGELPKAEGISEDTMGKLADNYEFAQQNLQSYKDAVAEHEKVLDSLSAQFIKQESRIQAITRAYLDGESYVEPEKARKNKFTRTINGKSGKFSMKKPRPETYETDSGQMSMLPAVEAETDAKNKLAEANEKVAKSQKKVKEAAQGTQLTIDDVVPGYNFTEMTPEEASEWLNGPDEAKEFEKVEKAAEKASKSKKKFAGANKEVKNSIAPSVDGLKAEAEAMEDVEESAEKTTKTISEEAKRAAESISFSTRDYERLYDEMEAFAEQRKAENGYDLSKVSVNTDAHGKPLGATISYYKRATKETITETFRIDKAAQEAEDGVNRLVLSSRKATAGIADFEKATLGAINRQDQLMAQKNKTISSLSGALDPNANRTLFGTDYEDEARKKIKAIEDEVAKLDQVIDGERVILSEKDFLATKRRITELTQEASDFINRSKNAEYAPTQLESHSVSSGNQYRADQLKAKINEWERAGIYVGDLKKKAEELSRSVTNITKHEDLKKYLEGMKEARALATLATQDKKAEEERQKALNKEYDEYIKLIGKRNAIEAKMIGLDPEKNRNELAALQADYDAVDNEFNSKYGDFLSRKDVQEHFTIDELAYADDAAKREMAAKKSKAYDKKRLEEEAAAQKKVNEAYTEYVRLIKERGRASIELAGLDPEKNKLKIDELTNYIEGIDEKLSDTYGDLLSNHIAQATLSLDDFTKHYDKWQQKLRQKEAEAADKARNKEELPYRNYGKTTANSAQRKLDATKGAVDALGVTNPEVLAKLEVYEKKVKEVQDARDEFAKDPDAAKEPALVKKFQKSAYEAEQLRRGIKGVIDEEQKMAQMSEEQGFSPIELTSDQIANLENEMIAHAKATAHGRVEIKGWNDDHTKMYYTVTNSKGVVEEMTEALGQGTNRLYQYRTATKETGTLIQQIFKGIQTKAKELLSFVIGGGSIYKAIEMLRQGIQYVREIDLALTELKKVTNETEETYDRFLETAAKTGAKLGATISAVTEATATFAKLGYSMEQATEMAEAAIVYKNVGDNIASTEDAADSIISTMKGFKLEATESMAIVDRFNEVGNRFAITSQGIGEALRLSASALSEGGNSLDESIGLITAANEVVNDPSSVGTALKTLTLRLRGSKTELEEMGEDVSDMATTTSQLQAKLLALTGGQVDIMLDETTFKNSTQILREMADAWEDMDDISRASALELMGGRLLPLRIEICV